MKENFKCPICKRMQKVGKRLHSSWVCPSCHASMLLTRTDKINGTISREKASPSLTNRRNFSNFKKKIG